MMRARMWMWVAVVAAALVTWNDEPAAGQQPAGVAALAALHAEIETVRRPRPAPAVPDYSTRALEARAARVAAFQQRLAAIDPSSWPVPDQVDYHVVRAQVNQLDFEHRVSRPWARDPVTYVDAVRRAPYIDLPAAGDALTEARRALLAVPQILEAARTQLTAPSREMARFAIRQLEMSDGVNQGEPRRPVPPAGVIGWYVDLRSRAVTVQPALLPDVDTALGAVRAYRDWLTTNAPAWNAPAYVGLADYEWYLRNVRLVPYTVDEVRLIGLRELERARTLLAIERHRNRDLPAITVARTGEEHERRTRDAETLIRTFLTREKIITLPRDLPPTFPTDAFWIERAGGHRHFWEEITYRDPLNNHVHASIPGHQFDGIVQRAHTRPIRRTHQDGTRAEGWSFYIEEMLMQAGLLAERPRTRELFYIAQLKRGARIPAELNMQTGAFTLQDAIDYLIAEVPLMEADLARYDLAIYLRRPAYGMNYTVGKAQMERLVSDRALQLGDAFDLGAFHDEFLAAGPIPITLIRWEMTGKDDEITALLAKR